MKMKILKLFMLLCIFFTFTKVTYAKNVSVMNANNSFSLILDDNLQDKIQDGLDAFTCTNENVVKLLKIASIGLIIVKIVVPVILIIIGMVSLFNAFIADDQSAFSKALTGFIFKLVIGVCVFLLPSVLSAMISLINGADEVKSEFQACSKCLLDYCSCPGVSCNRKPKEKQSSKPRNVITIDIPK